MGRYKVRVEITFNAAKLQKICNSDKELTKTFGSICGRRIKRRLDDLKAAKNLEALRNLPGRCHELSGDRQGQLTLDLEHPLRLVFEPTGDFKKKDDGGLDWSSVTAVKVIEVEDTHD